ncbi:MAG TPA: ABC transporter permease [Candidatus Sulfopaludibacter sp.]|jgi:putative ABC transport system permease protein|nr:ABC transporter permease [Candidatus Sulfopaludibacter sp.]
MSLWRQLTRGLRALTHREAADRDVADEVRDYLERATAALEASGLSPDDARRAARLEYGSPTAIREQVRSSGWEGLLETLAADLRYAARQLLHNPGFALVGILTLALGIGASTAIFSAVNPILFQPLPYPDAGRLTMIREMPRSGSPRRPTFGTFHGLAESSRTFDAMAVMKPWQPTMVGNDQPERFEGQRVSAAYFRTLGVAPSIGRNFEASDDQFRGPNVIVLSDRLWRRRFAGDSAVLGKQVMLDDTLFTVIGVMPGSFENVPAPSAELWAPLQYDPSLPAEGREWGHHLSMVGRLHPGVSANQAGTELNAILHPFAQMHERGYECCGGTPDGMVVTRLQDEITRGVKPALQAILGAVVLVLLIACVNVTNLLLARSTRRRSEFALRAALGAGQGRLIRQLLSESLLLAVLGGIVGMAIAQIGVRALVAFSPPGLPRIGAIGVDRAVFVFGFGITSLVGLMVGLAPALRASHSDPQNGLQQSSRTTVGGHQFTRRVLVVAEVALALVLLVGAGLLLRSLENLFGIDPGFDGRHLLTMQVQESGRRFNDDSVRARFYSQALEAVRQVPGITSAAFTSQLPLSGDFAVYNMELESHRNEKSEGLLQYAVSPAYFDTMRIPLRGGRLLEERDRAGRPQAVLISESFAKRKFPGQNPIGQRVRIGAGVGHADRPWASIVGVVGDVKQTSLAVSAPDAFYTTMTQWDWVDTAQSLVVRAHGDAAALAPAIRKAIWSVDKDQPVVRVATMDKLLTESQAERHFALVLFEAFGFVSLVLAAVGIYGVLSGSVNERMREIGVRAALGASRRDILGLILRQGMTLTGIGVLIGLGGAVAASQALISMLYGITRFDPITYFGVVALLASVSGIACWVPAWRAAKVDPSITFRAG